MAKERSIQCCRLRELVTLLVDQAQNRVAVRPPRCLLPIDERFDQLPGTVSLVQAHCSDCTSESGSGWLRRQLQEYSGERIDQGPILAIKRCVYHQRFVRAEKLRVGLDRLEQGLPTALRIFHVQTRLSQHHPCCGVLLVGLDGRFHMPDALLRIRLLSLQRLESLLIGLDGIRRSLPRSGAHLVPRDTLDPMQDDGSDFLATERVVVPQWHPARAITRQCNQQFATREIRRRRTEADGRRTPATTVPRDARIL